MIQDKQARLRKFDYINLADVAVIIIRDFGSKRRSWVHRERTSAYSNSILP